jgi:3-hydroxyacyl-CoA dehydrogenase/enoyl-CoA hydratase/3-hydroxybutyryl-CoA epimerase/enoyl-CoA isomerase
MRLGFPHAVELFVQHGRLGQKSGSGFYRYDVDPAGKPKKSIDSGTAPLLASIQPRGPQSLSDPELLERLMLPMIVEAARCLEEGIAESAGEVDMSLVLGLGFPRYAGGPLKYADWLGMEHVVERCEEYKSLGRIYEPTDGMRSAAAARTRFYGGASRPMAVADSQPPASSRVS